MIADFDRWMEQRALSESQPDLDICPSCEGTGSLTDESMELDGFHIWQVVCETCAGDGRVDTSPCIVCNEPVFAHDPDCPVAQR